MGVEVAAIVGALAAVGGTAVAYKSGEEQKDETKKARATATEAQAEQEALALAEKKKSSSELLEAQQRLVGGTGGRKGLLFGTELGTENLKTTLG